MPRIRHVKGTKRMAYALTWEEQDRPFRHLPTGRDMGAALFAVNMGVRKAELFGIRWSDTRAIPELETIVFILTDTKNGQDRAVICNSVARLSVERQRGNGSRFVFPSRAGSNLGGQVRSSGKVWNHAWRKAGLLVDSLIRKRIHNPRHTFGHRLRSAGVQTEDRDALLGHSNKSLTQRYAMPDIERLLVAAELVKERKDTVALRSAGAWLRNVSLQSNRCYKVSRGD